MTDPFSASTNSSSSGFPASRLTIGLLGLGLLTLVFGFYFPLSKGHQALGQQYQALLAAVDGNRTQLERTTAELLTVKQERDGLSEKLHRVETARAAAAERDTALLAAVRAALAPKLKQAQMVVNEAPEGVLLVIDNARLYRDHQESLYPQGEKFLCEIAKALKDQAVTWTVSNEAAEETIKNPILHRLFPTTFQLTAARAAAAVVGLQTCGIGAKDLLVVGGGHLRLRKGSPPKSTGETRILLAAKQP